MHSSLRLESLVSKKKKIKKKRIDRIEDNWDSPKGIFGIHGRFHSRERCSSVARPVRSYSRSRDCKTAGTMSIADTPAHERRDDISFLRY